MNMQSITRPRFSFQKEKFSSVILDLQPLLIEHWHEIAVHKDVPLDIDLASYYGMEAVGLLRAYTVREEGALVGYASIIVAPHLHYKSVRYATSDVFWIKPVVRSTRSRFERIFRRFLRFIRPSLLRPSLGMMFFKFIEDDLRSENVHTLHIVAKNAHPAAARVLGHRGFSPVETVFAKRLRD